MAPDRDVRVTRNTNDESSSRILMSVIFSDSLEWPSVVCHFSSLCSR